MLSTEQQKLKNKTVKTNIAKSADSSYQVRAISGKYDSDRVTELWANLAMIQQMQGNDYWYSQSQQSKTTWNEFMDKTINARAHRVIVMETEEEIFGFAYMSIEAMHMNNPKKKNQLKAIITELYLEPGYRSKTEFNELGELMRQCLEKMGVDYVEIAVKGL